MIVNHVKNRRDFKMNKIDESVDWQKCLELTNHKPDLAKELLSMFARELPVLCDQITLAFENKDYEKLQNHAHKLHGACCYCGVPRLQKIVEKLETQLKTKQYAHIEALVNDLNEEAAMVIGALKNYEK